ncbi:MAG: F0F1 ATP synthase subunit B [Leptospiraceae bacterium]|nr:F0F1 ATP synthase subunit B [Leptospiraceae bacterium]
MILAAGLDLLSVNPGLLVWTIVTFLIVVFILKTFAWGPILSALDARSEKIHGDLERAEKLKQEAETLLADYKSKIAKAQEEAQAIVNEAKSDASNLKSKMIQEANLEIERSKEQSLKEIELSRLKALQDIQKNVVELSVSIASKILEKQLKPEDHANFVNSELEKIKKVKL